jgi:hypothetical protein
MRRHRDVAARAALAVAVGLLLISSLPGTVFAAASNSFTKTETISRVHLVNGADQTVETRTFTVSIDQTKLLRDRQEINVTWSGAHPTGGLVGDQNSGLAAEQEYPVVMMECRGIDGSSVAVAKRLSPETCWTHTPAERSQYDLSFAFPPYRLDRYALPADRKSQVGLPSPLPSDCTSVATGIQHWISFRAADGKVYPTGPFGCAGMPPEAVNTESSLQPSNTTYGASDLQGKGSSKFAISTFETNASLGCSDKVPCSLVIIPIIGISCDPAGTGLPPEDQPDSDTQAAAFAKCSATGRYKPGEFSPGTVNQEDLAVSGELWWSASNWRNRISVPLTFAQASNICSLVGNSATAYMYGSELLAQATQQWAPAFCLNPKLFKLQHVQTSEPVAKNLLQNGSIEAAFQSGPPQKPFSRPVVQAPVALSGFAIVYSIDDGTGHEYRKLKLTPRLLAKLLTESYPSDLNGSYPALDKNPIDLAHDPEFRALNPGPPAAGYNTEPASVLFSISSDSDVIWALTSYIEADPEARAWLEGAADPWGMVVNPNYKGIKLPVLGWPLLDTWQKGGVYDRSINSCLADNPVPFLPLVAAPVLTMAQVTLNMQFDIANSQIICKDSGLVNEKLVAIGRESPGKRFLIGLTSLADSERYQLDTAALQTHVAANAPKKFADATGRTFVEPSNSSLRIAASLLKSDDALGTWPIPYETLRIDPKGATAYPGTMLISADVPTSGLPKADAQRYAKFLRFAVTVGQTPGLSNGQLPPGYLPLTAANGLGQQAKYTLAAASAVAAQLGGVTSVSNLTTPGAQGSLGAAPPPPPAVAPSISPVARPVPTIAPPTVVPKPPLIAWIESLGSAFAGFGGLAFPLLLMLGGACGLATLVGWLVWRRRVSA